MDTKMNEENGEASTKRIQVRFVTKLAAPYKAPPTAIAIPVDLTRFGLSSVVNALLQSIGTDWIQHLSISQQFPLFYIQ